MRCNCTSSPPVNCPLERVDPALLRPGRLLASYSFERLSAAEAQALADAEGLTMPRSTTEGGPPFLWRTCIHNRPIAPAAPFPFCPPRPASNSDHHAHARCLPPPLPRQTDPWHRPWPSVTWSTTPPTSPGGRCRSNNLRCSTSKTTLSDSKSRTVITFITPSTNRSPICASAERHTYRRRTSCRPVLTSPNRAPRAHYAELGFVPLTEERTRSPNDQQESIRYSRRALGRHIGANSAGIYAPKQDAASRSLRSKQPTSGNGISPTKY